MNARTFEYINPNGGAYVSVSPIEQDLSPEGGEQEQWFRVGVGNRQAATYVAIPLSALKGIADLYREDD